MSMPFEDAFSSVPLFDALDPEKRAELAAASRVRTYPKGQVLCSEGDPGDELLVLETGRVRVSRFAPSGQEIVLAEVDAPGAFGELALVDGAPRAATVTAESTVQVRYLSREIVMDLVMNDPAVAAALLRSMAAMVRATNERLGDMLSLDVPGRLAKWLLAHADEQGKLTLNHSQEALALDLGTTRVTLNRALARFIRLAWIEMQGHKIMLRDIPALQALVE
jgi:CRP/FNR family transcriptional regulator